jgi:hypothetical protein
VINMFFLKEHLLIVAGGVRSVLKCDDDSKELYLDYARDDPWIRFSALHCMRLAR